ncbi:hypothetical protein AAE478_006140 [Parahypoxylon ruwenzoriense]
MAATTSTVAFTTRQASFGFYPPWPADLLSSIGGTFQPPTSLGDWSLGLESCGVSGGVEWPLPDWDGLGDHLLFGSDTQNGQQLDVSDILSGCEPSPDFLFNQPSDPPLPQEPDMGTADQSDQSFPSPPMPESSPSQGQTPKARGRSPPVDPVTALKRQRNNVAARKYRQKRIDRINELETELQGVKQERDDLRLRLARQEAEAAALRSMLQLNSGNGAKG